MKNREFKAFQAAIGSKIRKETKMTIFDQRGETIKFEPDSFCLSLWDITMPEWISDEVREELVDALIGFDDEMSLIIADNVIDCWSGLGLHVTGIRHVDELLGKLYMRILDCAHRKGIYLDYRF
jgi:hypothetical protein